MSRDIGVMNVKVSDRLVIRSCEGDWDELLPTVLNEPEFYSVYLIRVLPSDFLRMQGI